MKKITIILIIAIISISCQSEKEKELNDKSLMIFNNSIEKVNKSEYKINIDSFRIVYEKNKSENPQKGLDFANRFEKYSNNLFQKSEEIRIETINREARIQLRRSEEEAVKKRNWKNSKYGKLQKKHPSWTDEDCIKVLDKKICI